VGDPARGFRHARNCQESLPFHPIPSALQRIPCTPPRSHSTMGRHGKRDRVSLPGNIRAARCPPFRAPPRRNRPV
jgi:hypothetical protein